ncbi:hypothetical protein NEIG_01269 [Nematocida sp. ERTm5]|nr:hypothetical protein NEIG_01269 [Nematocida sp. ERTm5]
MHRKHYNRVKCTIVLNDLERNIKLDININNAFKEMQMVSEKSSWVIATVENCNSIPKKSFVQILQALKQFKIEELRIEEMEINLAHDWIDEIKTLKSISLHNSRISSVLICEIGRLPNIESLKISGESSIWDREDTIQLSINDTIRSIVVQNVRKGLMEGLFQSVFFASIRSISLNRSNVELLELFRSTNTESIRKIGIANEKIRYSDRLILQRFTNLEILSVTQTKVCTAGINLSENPEILRFNRLWQFKIDKGIYYSLFYNTLLETSERNFHLLINHPEDNFSIEYIPIINNLSRLFCRARSHNVLQIRVANLPNADFETSQLQCIDQSTHKSLPFIKDTQIEHLLVTFNTDMCQDKIQNVLETIVSQTQAYQPEKISIYFKYTSTLSRLYIDSLVSNERHCSLKEVTLNNIIVLDESIPSECNESSASMPTNNAPVSLSMKYVPKKADEHPWQMNFYSNEITSSINS